MGDKVIHFLKRRIHGVNNVLRRRRGHEDEPLLKSTSISGISSDDEESHGQTRSTPAASAFQKRTSYRDVLTRQSVLNLFVYTVLATHSLGFDQLIPVYLHQERQSPSDSDISLPFRFKGGFEICKSLSPIMLMTQQQSTTYVILS